MSEQEQQDEKTQPEWMQEYRLRSDLVQKDITAWEISFHALGGFRGGGSSVAAERALKAAIDAGWLAAPASEVLTTKTGEQRYQVDGEDVDGMNPGKVRYYGDHVLRTYTLAQQPPPN